MPRLRSTDNEQPAFARSNWWLREKFLRRLQEYAPEIVEEYRKKILPLEPELHRRSSEESDASYHEWFPLFEVYCERIDQWQRDHGFAEDGWGWVVRQGPGVWFGLGELEKDDPLLRNLILPVKGWSPRSTRESEAAARQRMILQATRCIDEYLRQIKMLAERTGLQRVPEKRERGADRREVFEWLIDWRCRDKSWPELIERHGVKLSTIRSAIARMEAQLSPSMKAVEWGNLPPVDLGID